MFLKIVIAAFVAGSSIAVVGMGGSGTSTKKPENNVSEGQS